MLEPSTEREDILDGDTLSIIASYEDDELIIDIGEENFVSI